MLIKNANAVFIDGVKKSDIRIEDGKITEIGDLLAKDGEEILDLTDKYLMAGFIDTHTHGAVGARYVEHTFDLNEISDFEASQGVTAVTPTFSSYRPDEISLGYNNIRKYMNGNSSGAKFVGIHLEGPFLNKERKGGMDEDRIIPPTAEAFNEFYDIVGNDLKILTIAPELEGSIAVIREAVKKGVKASAGHTSATYEQMKAAIDAGVTRMTHTFNAAVGINHRNPGVLSAALNDDRVNCEVICDFVHLHPAVVELIYKLKGAKNFTAISDSLFIAGLEEGQYHYYGRDYTVGGGVARLPDGTISGSMGTLLTGLHNLLSLGIPLSNVTVMLSANPAKAIGMYDSIGSIDIGKSADFAVFSREMKIEKTFVNGKCVFCEEK